MVAVWRSLWANEGLLGESREEGRGWRYGGDCGLMRDFWECQVKRGEGGGMEEIVG